jgi:hypothetical protein
MKPQAATMGGTGAATAAIASAPTGTASTASAPTEAAAGSACAPSETRECATTVSRGGVSTSAEKATAATAATAAVTTITTGAAKGVAGNGDAAAAVRTGETTLAGTIAGAATTATATTGDDERRVTGTDHESASTTATNLTRGTCAANSDLQGLPCGQAEIAADLGALTAHDDAAKHGATISALRAKSEDLIEVGGWRREGDEATGIREVEWHRVGGRP